MVVRGMPSARAASETLPVWRRTLARMVRQRGDTGAMRAGIGGALTTADRSGSARS